MAHHGVFPEPEGERNEVAKALRDFMQREAKTIGLGATRAFPQGVVNDIDEGEIQFAIKGDAERQKVFLNFGKPVDFLGMTPQQAVEVGQLLIKHARAVSKGPLQIVLH